MRFGENNVLCPKYINIYQFQGVQERGTYSTIHFLFIIQKNGKVEEHDLYLNQILHHFDLKRICRMNNKNFRKKGPQEAPLLFLYEVSIVVLIDFIAILLTPGIFLIQIVNTNVYLIHFHSKNIKMHFPKRWVLKFQTNLNHSLLNHSSQRDEINCVDSSKDFPTMYRRLIFKKTI